MKGIKMPYSVAELITRLERLSLWQPLGHDNQTLVKHAIRALKDAQNFVGTADSGIAASQREITRLTEEVAVMRVSREALDHALFLVVQERDEVIQRRDQAQAAFENVARERDEMRTRLEAVQNPTTGD